jgi:predicted acetyltransferase
LILVKPSEEHLASYVSALRRGYSPHTHRDSSLEELGRVERDAAAFLRSLEDREARGRPVELPDGSSVPRLPGYVRWMWDGEFSGSISLRWQPGTPALPPWCLGHISYGVVAWKRRRGYAKEALRLMLAEARKEKLPYVEIVTDIDNIASQRVIIVNGGKLVEKFDTGLAYGNVEGLRFRVDF